MSYPTYLSRSLSKHAKWDRIFNPVPTINIKFLILFQILTDTDIKLYNFRQTAFHPRSLSKHAKWDRIFNPVPTINIKFLILFQILTDTDIKLYNFRQTAFHQNTMFLWKHLLFPQFVLHCIRLFH